MKPDTLTQPQLKNTLAHLVKARELISSPSSWTQATHARADNGRPTSATGDLAVCFCSMGALRRAKFEIEGGQRIYHSDPSFNYEAGDALHHWLAEVAKVQVVGDVVEFNDASEHADVLRMFDGTIEMVKGLIHG